MMSQTEKQTNRLRRKREREEELMIIVETLGTVRPA